jgi:hypothetical protein
LRKKPGKESIHKTLKENKTKQKKPRSKPKKEMDNLFIKNYKTLKKLKKTIDDGKTFIKNYKTLGRGYNSVV